MTSTKAFYDVPLFVLSNTATSVKHLSRSRFLPAVCDLKPNPRAKIVRWRFCDSTDRVNSSEESKLKSSVNDEGKKVKEAEIVQQFNQPETEEHDAIERLHTDGGHDVVENDLFNAENDEPKESLEGSFELDSLDQQFNDVLSKDWDNLMSFDPEKPVVVKAEVEEERVDDVVNVDESAKKKKRKSKAKTKTTEMEEESGNVIGGNNLDEVCEEPYWYFVQVKPGCENHVSVSIQNLRKSLDTEDILDAFVPTTTVVTSTKGGQSVRKNERYFPGYILVLMAMNRFSYGHILRVTHVQGFMGDSNRDKKNAGPFRSPTPLRDSEMRKVFDKLRNSDENSTWSEKTTPLPSKVEESERVESDTKQANIATAEDVLAALLEDDISDVWNPLGEETSKRKRRSVLKKKRDDEELDSLLDSGDVDDVWGAKEDSKVESELNINDVWDAKEETVVDDEVGLVEEDEDEDVMFQRLFGKEPRKAQKKTEESEKGVEKLIKEIEAEIGDKDKENSKDDILDDLKLDDDDMFSEADIEDGLDLENEENLLEDEDKGAAMSDEMKFDENIFSDFDYEKEDELEVVGTNKGNSKSKEETRGEKKGRSRGMMKKEMEDAYMYGMAPENLKENLDKLEPLVSFEIEGKDPFKAINLDDNDYDDTDFNEIVEKERQERLRRETEREETPPTSTTRRRRKRPGSKLSKKSRKSP